MLKRITEEIELEKEFKKYSNEPVKELLYQKNSQIQKMTQEIEKLKTLIEIDNQGMMKRKNIEENNKKLLLDSMCHILESKNEIRRKLRDAIKEKEVSDAATSPFKLGMVDIACSPKVENTKAVEFKAGLVTKVENTKVVEFKAGVVKKMKGNMRTRKATRKNIN